ncbi:amidohydrolase family protein [Variovorax sp. Root434]|uniref:amidohydrolase family protein n=1 Tax=Variovorax sp. Root434 TaxID=1736536 RepID=UPI0039E17937
MRHGAWLCGRIRTGECLQDAARNGGEFHALGLTSALWAPLARLFDAWGFERRLWGTDWTRAVTVLDYDESVEAFRRGVRLSESERTMLMGGACARVYGWTPTKVAGAPD